MGRSRVTSMSEEVRGLSYRIERGKGRWSCANERERVLLTKKKKRAEEKWSFQKMGGRNGNILLDSGD